MRLHQFTLDSLTETGYGKGQYLFYYNNDNKLQAWTVERRNNSITEIKSFREATPGSMELGDIQIIKLPMELQGIKENGHLIFETQKGILECIMESHRVRITAKERTVERNQHEIKNINPRFPGMIQCDIHELHDIRLSRFTSCPSQSDEENLFQESILLMQQKNQTSHKKKDEIILVGPPTIDQKLQLISTHYTTLFGIPISNFNLEYQSMDRNIKIIGWNNRNVLIYRKKTV